MNAKDAMVGFLREGYQKKHGKEPTGNDARAIEKAATQTAEQSAARRQTFAGGK